MLPMHEDQSSGKDYMYTGDIINWMVEFLLLINNSYISMIRSVKESS